MSSPYQPVNIKSAGIVVLWVKKSSADARLGRSQKSAAPVFQAISRERTNGYTEKNIIPSQQKEGRWHKGFGSKNSV